MLTRETPLMIAGPSGQLEALWLDAPDARGVALICHPNPVQGGTMLNKVVSTLQRTARDSGLATLRFNYRGVGASAGSHDMASGEVDDAEAVANWLRAQHPELPLTLLGFSFGGFGGLRLGGCLFAVAGGGLGGRSGFRCAGGRTAELVAPPLQLAFGYQGFHQLTDGFRLGFLGIQRITNVFEAGPPLGVLLPKT